MDVSVDEVCSGVPASVEDVPRMSSYGYFSQPKAVKRTVPRRMIAEMNFFIQ